MNYINDGIREALRIIVRCDSSFLDIVLVSIKASTASILIATLTGVPFGIFIALKKFPGRNLLISILHSLMSLPTVVVGLLVYSFISRQGPLGELGLMYSLTAMIIGQFILAFPIVASLTITAISSMDDRAHKTLVSLGTNTAQRFTMLIREARYALIAAIIAGFGRVFAEIGVSMMLGGNIMGYTRNITTAIALETSKGEFAMGFALGMVLLTVAFTINATLTALQRKSI